MKRTMAMLLAMLMLAGLCPALAEDAAQTPLTVGITTPMTGYFFTDMWGNNTVDADIRALLHGYGTVVWKTEGAYGLDDTVVTDMTAAEGGGTHTYTLTIAQDMTYNDGTPITAADYVFSVLLQSDPVLPQLEGMNTNFSHLIGYSAYASGETGVFTGVRLLGDYQFSLSVPTDALPYFYEMTYAAVEPCPISVIAPGYAVADDGNGAYLTANGAAATLTAELLAETLTGENGYVHQPRITCGPYQLKEYDAASGVASFTLNPAYRGNWEGRKPEVAEVTVRQVASGDAAAAFEAGEIQILHKLSDGDAIAALRTLAADGKASTANYLRSGYAFLGFACEQTPTDDVRVRKAIALCIDRDTIVADVFQGNGLSVSGYYGYGQWMAAQHMEELAQFDIGYNLDEARALLEEAGYIYNEAGGTFTEGAGETRCKVEDGAIVPLELRWAKAASVPGDYLEQLLTPVFEQLGIRLVVNNVTFAELVRSYYRLDGERTDNLYFLSDNFLHVFDPYYTYNTADQWQGVFNTSGLRDQSLMDAADAMRRVSGDDTDGYYTRWLAFQTRWHELMPTAPIYSNVYYDACIPTLYGYTDNAQFGFSAGLLYATYTEPVVEAPVEDVLEDTPQEDTGDVITIE